MTQSGLNWFEIPNNTAIRAVSHTVVQPAVIDFDERHLTELTWSKAMIGTDATDTSPADSQRLLLAPAAAQPRPVTSPRSLLAGLIPLGIWAGALFGSLSMGNLLDGRIDEHSVCGPWGCGPTTSALVSWHSFCLVLIVPPIVFTAFRFPGSWVRWLGCVLTASGAVALIGIAVWVAISWLPRIDPGQPTYFVQRYLFFIFAEREMISIPIAPLTLAGFVLLVWPSSSAALQSRCRGVPDSTTADHLTEPADS